MSRPLPIANEQAQAALDRAVEQVRLNLPKYTKKCQNHSSVDNIYPVCGNTQWTCGFWPGEVWLAYERAHDEAFLQTGKAMVESFHRRIVKKIRVAHHDMGFLYTPACVAAYKLTGDRQAREAAILAADQLISRFQPKGEFIQAWGRMGAKMNYRFIIDCLLNLPLLYWAGNETGDGKYADIANRHTATCMANSFREDGSTFHTFYMNKDGTPGYGRTCQGYRDDSFWARGQAWGVYGSILSYRYTGDPAALDTFKRALAFYLTRLPEDLVPCWDMLFQPDSGEPRDSSSAAIVACGLLEAVRILPREESGEYEKLAREMVGSLAERYAVPELKVGTGLILHGTYSKKSPYNTCFPEGVDECTSWGDFFYMEALTRLAGEWDPYW
mgnify:FL=1